MSTGLPFSQACENNKEPILAVLREHLGGARQVLEIGSGTGQHAVHFAPGLPHLIWTASDLPENHPGIRAWMAHAPAPNLRGPLALDVAAREWPVSPVDAVFSANTAHIMPWDSVLDMVRGVAGILRPGGRFLLYGPFSYSGEHTSEGNARFDASLRRQGGCMGIRDAVVLQCEAAALGLVLHRDHAMPANNRTLVFAIE